MTCYVEVDCLAHYADDDYSMEWGARVMTLWLEQKKAFIEENLSLAEFRYRLGDALIEAADWESQFTDAAAAAGVDFEDFDLSAAYAKYKEEHRHLAFKLVPSNLYTEFRWIPEWNEGNLDELIETHGLRSNKWRSCDFEDIQPGNWLALFLKLVNVSSDELVSAVKRHRPHAASVFEQRVVDENFVVATDPHKAALLTAKQVIEVVENSYYNAIPVVHAEINLRALLELDPGKPFTLTSDQSQQVHIGLHDFVNGAGYMTTCKGKIVVPPHETGFSGLEQWAYGINKTYGLVRHYFNTTPTNV